jgi:hypothetical protein
MSVENFAYPKAMCAVSLSENENRHIVAQGMAYLAKHTICSCLQEARHILIHGVSRQPKNQPFKTSFADMALGINARL